MTRLHTRTPLVILACLAVVLAAASCKSPPPPSMEGLSAAEIFQRAQDEAEKGNYEQAIRYYEAFRQVRPDDRERGAWASYEIAFLYHKMKNDDLALTLFDQLLAQYAAEGSGLPPGPRVLAEKLRASIIEGRAPRAAPADGKG
jgi:outer membrane protein assembly factor BamD (BamD/ComL family)